MVPYKEVFQALEKSHIRYVVAGGFAVNFHQVQRATVDLDLIIEIEKSNILNFVALMKSLGYVPRVSVRPEDLADEEKRTFWIKDKGMMVFSFINPKNPMEVIDLFTEEPFPFKEVWNQRMEVIAFGLTIPVLGKKHLIEMKKRANRDKDRFDIQELSKID